MKPLMGHDYKLGSLKHVRPCSWVEFPIGVMSSDSAITSLDDDHDDHSAKKCPGKLQKALPKPHPNYILQYIKLLFSFFSRSSDGN